MTAIMRLPSAAYVVQKTLDPDSVSHRNATIGSWPTAIKVVEDLERAGWRLVPGRYISQNSEDSVPVMVEGQIRSADILRLAQEFDQLDADLFTAVEFASWLNAEVRGSPESVYLERKALR